MTAKACLRHHMEHIKCNTSCMCVCVCHLRGPWWGPYQWHQQWPRRARFSAAPFCPPLPPSTMLPLFPAPVGDGRRLPVSIQRLRLQHPASWPALRCSAGQTVSPWRRRQRRRWRWPVWWPVWWPAWWPGAPRPFACDPGRSALRPTPIYRIHTHTHTRARAHTHVHIYINQSIYLSIYTYISIVCVCVCVYM
jgi:hypothetical protein